MSRQSAANVPGHGKHDLGSTRSTRWPAPSPRGHTGERDDWVQLGLGRRLATVFSLPRAASSCAPAPALIPQLAAAGPDPAVRELRAAAAAWESPSSGRPTAAGEPELRAVAAAAGESQLRAAGGGSGTRRPGGHSISIPAGGDVEVWRRRGTQGARRRRCGRRGGGWARGDAR